MTVFHILWPRGTNFADQTGQDARFESGPALVAERFSWRASLFTPFWALYHGLWRAFLGWLGATLLLSLAGIVLGAGAAFWLYVALAAWFGFAASDLRLAALIKKGHTLGASYVAHNEGEAILRGLHSAIGPQSPLQGDHGAGDLGR